MRALAIHAFLTAALAVSTFAPLPSHAAERQTFLTRESLEPDIWASVWLIDRVAGKGGEIVIDRDREDDADTLSFGYPGADLFVADGSHYRLLLEELDIDDPALRRLGELVGGVEALGWRSASDADVARFEDAFRRMQSLHGRYWVPLGCYRAFFDSVLASLGPATKAETTGWDIAVPADDCRDTTMTTRPHRARVREMAIGELLDELGRGADVVFVDTREPSEYAEAHIPGALSLPFRDVADADLERLRTADVVVPYCVKDFRGYEVARLLQRLGVDQVALMRPFGLAGWLQEGLPVSTGTTRADAAAVERLEHCARHGCSDDS